MQSGWQKLCVFLGWVLVHSACSSAVFVSDVVHDYRFESWITESGCVDGFYWSNWEYEGFVPLAAAKASARRDPFFAISFRMIFENPEDEVLFWDIYEKTPRRKRYAIQMKICGSLTPWPIKQSDDSIRIGDLHNLGDIHIHKILYIKGLSETEYIELLSEKQPAD